MKTKLLYILVSTTGDVYLEQAFVSVSSARRHNPGAEIVLLTDQATAEGLDSRGPIGKAFQALFSSVVVAPLDGKLPAMLRSRLLKTGMRSYVEGDFLFIDADTIVARPLDEIDAVEAPLAACRDLHSPFAMHPHRQATINLCRRLHFDVSGAVEYFNSGVLLVKDTPATRAFFEEWRDNYEQGYAAGVRPDQPSLAKTLASSALKIALLGDEWNCEVQNGVRYLRDAYIVHYMVTNVGSGPQDQLFLLNRESVLLAVRSAGGITPEVQEVLDNPCHGYAAVTQVFAGEDLYLFRTRRYRCLRKHYRHNRWSFREFLLKIKDHLFHKL